MLLHKPSSWALPLVSPDNSAHTVSMHTCPHICSYFCTLSLPPDSKILERMDKNCLCDPVMLNKSWLTKENRLSLTSELLWW